MRSLFFATAFTALYLSVFGARPVHACLAPLALPILAPSADATDVPLNASIWGRRPHVGPEDLKLYESLSGDEIPLTAQVLNDAVVRFTPDALRPDTAYRIEDERSPRDNVVFRTGTAASAPMPPRISGAEVDPPDHDCGRRSGTLDTNIQPGHMFAIFREPGSATTIDTLTSFRTSAPGTTYITLGANSDLDTVHVSLVDLEGHVSPTYTLSEARRTGGCAQSGPADASFLIAWLVLLASRLRRRRSGAQ